MRSIRRVSSKQHPGKECRRAVAGSDAAVLTAEECLRKESVPVGLCSWMASGSSKASGVQQWPECSAGPSAPPLSCFTAIFCNNCLGFAARSKFGCLGDESLTQANGSAAKIRQMSSQSCSWSSASICKVLHDDTVRHESLCVGKEMGHSPSTAR